MSKVLLKTSLSAPLLPTLLLPTLAMANTPTVMLDPEVISVSRSPESIRHVPARVTLIDEQTLNQNPTLNLDNVLKEDASINVVTSGGLGQTSSVFLRGTNSNHTLFLRDGIRLNNASSGAASPNFLDTNDISRVEVLKGPSSVLYGTDAIGGVVQLISKKPTHTGVSVMGVYGDNNTYKTSASGHFVADNGFYAKLSGQILGSDGTPVKDTPNAPNASYDQKGGSAKVGYDHERFAVFAEYAHNQGTNQYDNFGTPTAQDFTNKIAHLNGRFHLNNDMSIDARLSQLTDNTTQKDPNYLGHYDFANTKTKEADIHATWRFTPRQHVLIGTTHRRMEGDVLSYGTPYEAGVDSQGYYIQHQFHHAKFNTQTGIRLEDNDKYGTHTIGQGAIRYHLTPETSFYGNVGTAFRSPSLNELYGYGGNTELKPEESLSYEVGVNHDFNTGLTLGVSVYHTRIKHLIHTVDVGGFVFQNQNIEKATISGGELSLKWQKEDFFVETSYHYTKTKNKNTQEELSRRPRHRGVMSVGLDKDKYGISTSLSANSRYDNTAFDVVQIAGRATVDVHGYWHMSPHAKLFANIHNVGDVKYPTAFGSGSYYIDGGRWANVGVTFSY